MGQNLVPVRQLHPKHRVREQLDNGAFYFNCVFARHVKISGSSLVIKTVCSKCAEGIPPRGPPLQPSSSSLTAAVPILIIGSIASVIPAFNFGPLPCLP